MFPFADVVKLLANELTSPGAGGFSLPRISPRAPQRFFFGHGSNSFEPNGLQRGDHGARVTG